MYPIYYPSINSPYSRWCFYISPHPLVVELWCVDDDDDDVIFFLLSCSVDLFLEGNLKGLFIRKYPIYSYYTLSCRYYGRLIYITKCRRNSWAPISSSCHPSGADIWSLGLSWTRYCDLIIFIPLLPVDLWTCCFLSLKLSLWKNYSCCDRSCLTLSCKFLCYLLDLLLIN